MTPEENELLTRTGPGTPCGELMRRYWQPAALSEEVAPGGAPLPVTLFGEEKDFPIVNKLSEARRKETWAKWNMSEWLGKG